MMVMTSLLTMRSLTTASVMEIVVLVAPTCTPTDEMPPPLVAAVVGYLDAVGRYL